MSRDKAETIAYAIRKECQKDSLYDWCETWDITIDEFEEFLANGINESDENEQSIWENYWEVGINRFQRYSNGC